MFTFLLFLFFKKSSPKDMMIDLRETQREHRSAAASRRLPGQGSDPQLFGVQDSAPANWATWPGQLRFYIFSCICLHDIVYANFLTYFFQRFISTVGFFPLLQLSVLVLRFSFTTLFCVFLPGSSFIPPTLRAYCYTFSNVELEDELSTF